VVEDSLYNAKAEEAKVYARENVKLERALEEINQLSVALQDENRLLKRQVKTQARVLGDIQKREGQLRKEVLRLKRWINQDRKPSGIDREWERAEIDSWPSKLIDMGLAHVPSLEHHDMVEAVRDLNESVNTTALILRNMYKMRPEWFPGVNPPLSRREMEEEMELENLRRAAEDYNPRGLDYSDE
jgi:hypothetical protein